ncbi:hypothetical protein BFP70_05050 [Thioclava sp. SK-1]|uniref:glycosyltransferase family 4 protein n=1 Tax=Thioclava sp. SK-1 TaxID=1889770 RepID=UPI0008240D6E|nr:glycosyltransferase family 4 protein [Thioclava sp. SK-1]OCX66394.1 hypothetical protein BFP70_05050 [Thioclava sp. SK-1]
MIAGRYTLFSRIPAYEGPDGSVHTTPLWAKDLQLHLGYIADFALCCPLLPLAQAEEDTAPVAGLHADQVTALREDHGWGSVGRNFIGNFRAVVRAARGSRIVHSDGAGWAFPLAFYLLPLSFVMGFRWIMVIESSFWMMPKTGASLRQRISHGVHKTALRLCLKRADLRIFTQDGYRRLFGIGTERSLIAPAVWINEDQILTPDQNMQRLSGLSSNMTRFIFPARLVPDKGITAVLQAIDHLDRALLDLPEAQRPDIGIDLIGEGPLQQECQTFCAVHDGPVQVRFLSPVPYGAPFFALLGQYHAIVLANRQHEQPRVIFDAFSQGVPVISSDTEGVRDIIRADNSLLFPVDDPAALAQALLRFAKDPQMQAQFANAARDAADGHSHKGMHETRADAIAQHIPA